MERKKCVVPREVCAVRLERGRRLVTASYSITDSIIWLGRYNDIYRVQMPNITPHVCRHTYCSNMAKSGMNPKTLQYLMGHSDISVTMNVYTHIGFDDAEEELKRMEEFRKAQTEVEQKKEKTMSQKMFKVV